MLEELIQQQPLFAHPKVEPLEEPNESFLVTWNPRVHEILSVLMIRHEHITAQIAWNLG